MIITYIIYFFTLFFSIFFAHIGVKQSYRVYVINSIQSNNLKFNQYYFWAILLIILITGLRDKVGIDSNGYIDLYDRFKKYPEFEFLISLEPGFVFPSYFFNQLNLGYFSIFLFSSIITWVFFTLSNKQYYELLPWVILITFLDGFMFFTMNGMRQAISIAIFTFAIQFIYEKKFLKYIIAICFAFLFHYSAIFLLPVYFIRLVPIRPNRLVMFSFVLLYILTTLFNYQIYIQEYILNLFNYFPRYSAHESNLMEYRAKTSSGLGVIFKHIINVLLIIFSLKMYNRFPKYSILITLLLFSLILSNLTYGIQILSRFSAYFFLVRTIAIGMMIKLLFERRDKYLILFGILLIIIFLLQFLIAIDQSAHGCSPYKSILFN